MDYSQLSDFEINNLVALAIGAKVTDRYRVGDVRESVYYALGEDEFCVRRGYGSIAMQFDPCNSASDAWPIITENKISIYAMSEADARGKWGAEAFYPNEVYHFNDNPLRASMIVFLMMQDEKHA